METTKKDLEYYRKNAEEDYRPVPISVLRYITEMEQALRIHDKDLEYCRKNAEEDYLTVPISVLRYITEMEQALRKNDVVERSDQLKAFLDYCDEAGWIKNIDKNKIIKDYNNSLT